MTRRIAWTLVGMAILVGTALRFTGINSTGLRGDEIASLAVSTGHYWHGGWEAGVIRKADYYRSFISLDENYFSQRLVSVLRSDVHPPLYFFLLNLWLHLFGTSEAAVRSLSVFASVASIPLMYAMGRQIFSVNAGAYSALIFSVAPFQIAYAQEARPYSLSVLLALLSTLIAVRLCHGADKWRWFFAYGASILLGLYTHYLFFLNMIFHLILVILYRRNGSFLVRWALTQFVVLAGVLLWVSVLFEQLRWSYESGYRSGFSGIPLSGSILYFGRDLSLFLSVGGIKGICSIMIDRGQCQVDTVLTWLFYSVSVLMILLCALPFFLQRIGKSTPTNRTYAAFTKCILWGICISVGTMIIDAMMGSDTIKSPRYVIYASAPLYLALALSLSWLRDMRVRVAAVAALLLFLVVGSAMYLLGVARSFKYEQSFRDAASYVNVRANRDDLVLVLQAGRLLLPLVYYLRPDLDVAGVLPTSEYWYTRPDIPARIEKLVDGRARVWFLDDHENRIPGQASALAWLREYYTEIDAREFENLDLFLFSP